MSRQVLWSKSAARDFDEAFQYLIDNRGVEVAELINTRLDLAIKKLAIIPTGRIGSVSGSFEKVVPKTSYIIAYRETKTALTIARIIHTSRDWQEGEFPN